jgi:acyl transferase domain-containing protein
VLAARDPEELRAQAGALRARVAATPPQGLAGLATSVAGQVAAQPQRAVVLAHRRDDVLRGLDGLVRGAPGMGVVHGRARESARVAFVFSPLRVEYAGMGLGLLDRYAAFAAQMAACEEALEPLVEWSLGDVLRGHEGIPPFERLDVSQPVLFAISSSLAELWRSFGVRPGAVLGHSVGEIAAAAACRGLSLTDAARVAATWGRSSMRLEGTGTMASLPLSAKQVERRLEPWQGRLAISGLNAPNWTAISGETAAVEALLAELATEGVAGRLMGIEAPGHSSGMAPIHDWFAAELSTISPRSGTVPFCSAAEGKLVDSANLDARYWSRNLSRPVLFEAAIRALRKAAYDVFVEIGPRPILTSAITEIVAAEEGAVAVGSWEQGEVSQFPFQLAEAYVLGVEVDWGAVCRDWRAGAPGEALRLSGQEHSLAHRLAELPEEKREPLLLDLVRREVATVLGHTLPSAVDPGRSFKDLGFNSSAAVELRQRLNRATGLALNTTLAFDHPTPRAVARKIRFEFEGGEVTSSSPRGEPAPDADTERVLRDIDELDLAGLVERSLSEPDVSTQAARGD